MMLPDGTIHETSDTYTPADLTKKNVYLGRPGFHSSMRFEKPWYGETRVRLDDVEAQTLVFYENLTHGTSMEYVAPDWAHAFVEYKSRVEQDGGQIQDPQAINDLLKAQ